MEYNSYLDLSQSDILYISHSLVHLCCHGNQYNDLHDLFYYTVPHQNNKYQLYCYNHMLKKINNLD